MSLVFNLRDFYYIFSFKCEVSIDYSWFRSKI